MSKCCINCNINFKDDVCYCPACGSRLQDPEDFTQPQERDSFFGKTIEGRYTVQEIIGRGGMGIAYRATQNSIDRSVALKLIHPHLTSEVDVVRRFFREAKIVSKLRHPNTVSLLDFGQTEDKLLFLVMEFLEGILLSEELKKGRFLPHRTLRILSQVCSAVHEAHESSIIHRDLKPDNIFLTQIGGDEFVKVFDFGIAKVLESSVITNRGQLMGTPSYMAPEQVRGKKISSKTDMYSVGVMMYEMLSGQKMFSGEDLAEVALMHLYQEPVSMDKLNPPVHLPTDVNNILYALLAKDPDNRPDSMKSLSKLMLKLSLDMERESVESILSVSVDLRAKDKPQEAVSEVTSASKENFFLEFDSEEIKLDEEIPEIVDVPNTSTPKVEGFSISVARDETNSHLPMTTVPSSSEFLVIPDEEDLDLLEDKVLVISKNQNIPATESYPEVVDDWEWPDKNYQQGKRRTLVFALLTLFFCIGGIWTYWSLTGKYNNNSTAKEISEQENNQGLADITENKIEVEDGISAVDYVPELSTTKLASRLPNLWQGYLELFKIQLEVSPSGARIRARNSKIKYDSNTAIIDLLTDPGPFELYLEKYKTKRISGVKLLLSGKTRFTLSRGRKIGKKTEKKTEKKTDTKTGDNSFFTDWEDEKKNK